MITSFEFPIIFFETMNGLKKVTQMVDGAIPELGQWAVQVHFTKSSSNVVSQRHIELAWSCSVVLIPPPHPTELCTINGSKIPTSPPNKLFLEPVTTHNTIEAILLAIRTVPKEGNDKGKNPQQKFIQDYIISSSIIFISLKR